MEIVKLWVEGVVILWWFVSKNTKEKLEVEE